MQAHTKYALDGASVGATVATLNGWLPPIAAALSIIWLSIQIADWAVNKFKNKQ